MQSLVGACKCSNVFVKALLTTAPGTARPRACGCAFCTGHGATYLSDPKGKLEIVVNDWAATKKFKNGDAGARFLVCTGCKTLVCALYENKGHTYASLNSQCLDATLQVATTPTPHAVPAIKRRMRWQAQWFKDITLI